MYRVFQMFSFGRLHLRNVAIGLSRSLYTVPVEVGATLNLDLPSTNMRINVTGGSDFEHINFQVFGDHNLEMDTVSVLDITSSTNIVYVKYKRDEICTAANSLFVGIPEKWCNLQLNAGCKEVQIQNMNEANILLKTGGGDVRLGKVKGNEASVCTHGGSFTATMLSAKCNVNTAGGKMVIEKLLGTEVNLNSGHGEVIIRSLYAEDLDLKTSFGSVDIEYMQATSKATMITGGGGVRINGLDGKSTVVSQGGNVDLQLCDAAKEVVIDSGEGNVSLCISSQLDAKVEHLGDGKLTDKRSIYFEDGDGFTRSRRLGLQDVNCIVKWIGTGNMVVKRRSWLESVKLRLEK